MSLNILVVDDDMPIRDLLQDVLEGEGHNVTQADNGLAALDALTKHTFNLVITDIRMPHITGIELLKKIKDQFPKTYVVIISSYATKDNAIDALKLGAFDYMEKPFSNLDIIIRLANNVSEDIIANSRKATVLKELKNQNTELARANKILRNVAIHDALTGLYNRSFLETVLIRESDRAKRYSRDLSLLFIDIDSFKSFNDNYGHNAGDFILQRVAKLIKKTIRQSDVAIRYGGDEFVIVLPETSMDSAYHVAEKIRGDVAASVFEVPRVDENIGVTVSAGTASLKMPASNDDTEFKLLERADKALYQAKNLGRNQTCIVE